MLVAAMSIQADVAHAQWRTTTWEINCDSESIGEAGGDHEERGFLLTEEECDFEGTGPAAFFAQDLEAASVWLDSLGFRAPRATLFHQPLRYEALIANTVRLEELCENVEVLGCYWRGELFIEQNSFFSMGQEEGDLTWDNERVGTAAHELFHAITDAYPSFRDQDWPMWITEGTAELVALQHTRLNRGLAVNPSIRSFSHSLHHPDPANDTLDAYRTWIFWSAIGSVLESPDQLAYLHDLFEQQDFSTHNGLEGVDAGLRPWGGLYELYPYILTAPYIRTRADHAYDLTETTLQIPGREADEYRSLAQIEPVAANGYRITLRIPPGKRGLLTATVEAAPGGSSTDLHLVVDAEVIASQPHAEFFDPGEHEVLVVVANVAPEAKDSRRQGYDLKVTLEPVQCDQDDLWHLLADLGESDGWRARLTGTDEVRTGTIRGGINRHGDLHLSLQAVRTAIGERDYLPTFALRVPGPVEAGEREYGVGEGGFLTGTMTVPGGTAMRTTISGADETLIPSGMLGGVPTLTVADAFNMMLRAAESDDPPRRVMFRDIGGSVWFTDEAGPELARGVFDILASDRGRPGDIYHFCGAFQQSITP
jgi:hypothetical protein